MTKRRILLLGAAAVVAVPVIVVVGLLVHWLVGLLAGVVVGLAVVWRIVQSSRRAVMGTIDTRSLSVEESPRLHNLVEGACASHGFPYPDVRIAEVDSVNAALIGESAEDAVLIVTAGLLERCSLLGLEAVVVNALIRSRVTDLGAASLLPGLLPLVPVAGWRDRLASWVVGDQPRVRADLASVRITRYPPGLVSVLEALRSADTLVPGVSEAADHLWLARAFEWGSRRAGSGQHRRAHRDPQGALSVISFHAWTCRVRPPAGRGRRPAVVVPRRRGMRRWR